MPWPAKQRAAIAADMRRKGKSREAISRFFHEHGYGGKEDRKPDHHGPRRRMKHQ